MYEEGILTEPVEHEPSVAVHVIRDTDPLVYERTAVFKIVK